MGNKKPKPLLGQVRDAVDKIYELTTANGGYHGSFVGYTQTFGKVIHVLVSRGIVSRSRKTSLKSYIYSWATPNHPTDNLYKSITHELRDRQKAYEIKSKAKKMALKKTEIVKVPVVNELTESLKKEYVTSLDGFSSQELWDELKKRGFGIEGDRIVKKAYLN